MSKYLTNDCVGCPQGCIHCGRDMDYYVYQCDECCTECSEDEIITEDGKDYCPKCWDEKFGEGEEE